METMSDNPSTILLDLLAGMGVLDDPAGWWVQPAAGGVNNQVYLAGRASEDAALTVRLATPRDDPRLAREAQVIMSLQSAAPCVPKLLATTTAGPAGLGTVLVYRYAAGETRPLEQVSLELAHILGRCLARLHAITHDVYTIWPDLGPQRGSYAEFLRDRLAVIKRYRSLRLPEFQAIYRRLEAQPTGDDWNRETFCQLHGDLGPGNIIWGDGNITLIDWEYTRAGDPAEDLAYLLTEQPVGSTHRRAIFDGYLAAGGSPGAIKRHTTYLPLVALDSALWWADWALVRDLDPASLPQFQERLSLTTRLLDIPPL